MDLTPYYIDARNAITQPDRLVFVSQYFRRHWMPALGPLGTAVVIYLRGACYYNRKSGETRDTVQVPQREIAAGCGCSVPTLKRELERNAALRRFVAVSQEWERDPATGRVRQVENNYKVAMDDPLTDGDEVRLRTMVDERVTRERAPAPGKPIRRGVRSEESGSTACSTAASALGRKAVKEEGSNAVNDAVITASSNAVTQSVRVGKRTGAPVAQNELLRPVAHFESPPVQNELLSEESLLKTTQKETLNVGPRFADASGKREPPPSMFVAPPEAEAAGIVEELRDWGSERRHQQLLAICERHDLHDLPAQALRTTRQRMAREGKQGVVEKPGAYYASVLVKLLEDRQVFVPTAGDDDPEEVRRLVRLSLRMEEGT